MEKLQNKLAALQHEFWCSWLYEFLSSCVAARPASAGTGIVPAAAAERWRELARTSFQDLPEEVQERYKDQIAQLQGVMVIEQEKLIKELNEKFEKEE